MKSVMLVICLFRVPCVCQSKYNGGGGGGVDMVPSESFVCVGTHIILLVLFLLVFIRICCKWIRFRNNERTYRRRRWTFIVHCFIPSEFGAIQSNIWLTLFCFIRVFSIFIWMLNGIFLSMIITGILLWVKIWLGPVHFSKQMNLNNLKKKTILNFPCPLVLPFCHRSMYRLFHVVSPCCDSTHFRFVGKIFNYYTMWGGVVRKPNIMLFSLCFVCGKKLIHFISADVFEIPQLSMEKMFIRNSKC